MLTYGNTGTPGGMIPHSFQPVAPGAPQSGAFLPQGATSVRGQPGFGTTMYH